GGKPAMDFAAAYQAQEKFAGELQPTNKGLQILTLPPAEVAKMKELAKPIVDKAIDDLEKQGKPAKEFFAAYTKYPRLQHGVGGATRSSTPPAAHRIWKLMGVRDGLLKLAGRVQRVQLWLAVVALFALVIVTLVDRFTRS